MTNTAITSDEVQVAFDVDGTGPAILFVHGLGDERRIWAPIVARLRGRFVCVTLDLRGHGETSGARDYGPFGLARDIAAVSQALGLSNPIVVGHSLGGFAATLYAARHGASAVINVDQSLELSALAASVQKYSADIRAGAVADVLWSVLESIGLGPLPSSLLERLRATRACLRSEVLAGVWQPLLEESSVEIAAAVDRALAGIRAPYLALHGAPPDDHYAGWLRARVPGVTIETWGGYGHFLHLAAPDRFVARLVEHVTQGLVWP